PELHSFPTRRSSDLNRRAGSVPRKVSSAWLRLEGPCETKIDLLGILRSWRGAAVLAIYTLDHCAARRATGSFLTRALPLLPWLRSEEHTSELQSLAY